MAYTQANYEDQVRELLQDTGTANNNRMVEDLTTQVVGGNGSRTVFTLSRTNLVTTSGYSARLDVNQSGFSTGWISSVDSNLGILTTSSAPPLSTSVPTNVTAMYYFKHFADSDIDNFVNFGLGQVSTTPPMTGGTSATTFQNFNSGQFNVVCLFAASQGYYALANRYAPFVDSSADGKSSGKSVISTRYEALGDSYLAMAQKEREQIYGPRQGTSTVASIKFKNQGSMAAITGYGGTR